MRALPLMLSLALAAAAPGRANAIPLFSHEYGVTCQKCHTVIPHLNAFGDRFLNSGYRIPGVSTPAVFPVSVKLNVAASTVNQGAGENGTGLPKVIVDEIELFTAGTVGTRANYFFEQYVVDGGEPGLLRDAWLQYRANPWQARIPVFFQAGSFTLPLPVDPETFRETYSHYAIFDQRIGANPFAFFDPKAGVEAGVGSALHGAALRLFAGPGHDRASGLATTGTDSMVYAQQIVGSFTLSAYRYTGERPGTAGLERFSRTGYGAVFARGKWTSENVIQTGLDTAADGSGNPSGGGFSQLRYAVGPRFFALARYEATGERVAGWSQEIVALLGYRPTHDSRFTIENVVTRSPFTTNTLNAQLTVAY